ncbi:MAG: sugar ABC transporter ATP-binding protein [Pseudotabrizicola sp.]|uniref:sugar ABC transporter ATP-binding protein n=1 Tax=Pseudotabrizicola sp. TaxID=2939647 RepID=UPI00272F5371|nr:sugar ABC transporter ATP-binding protein [Pseudotabrizicola sp.]MDP2079602.1 sugar ABC transporter ATP-binding protein [Pseudotabrizicola sp.]MDZ7576371.1 sugar ABC transporter ATP-binding protein [Pseudotabrizicola sp.]
MTPILEVEGLAKSFSGVPALIDGSFRLEAGSVHALCGGNGAGKSTFLKIIMGLHHRDAGSVRLNGREVSFANPSDALHNGIAIVEQELSPVPAMSVAENIYMGREPLRSFGRIDFQMLNRQTQDLLDGFSFAIRANDLMMDLTVAQTQLVEIAKALSYDAEVIILDEPTSALGEAEADHLFEAIATLKAKGKGIIYVSHRLSEIFAIADHYTVFRDGRFVQNGAIDAIDKEQLIQLIVGRPLSEEFIKENTPSDKIALRVHGLAARRGVSDLSFDLHEGEILGLYGLMGSGRTEVLERLFGLSHEPGGRIEINGSEACIAGPKDAIAAGIALVTEDRKQTGLVLSASVRDNLCLSSLGALSVAGYMRRNREAEQAANMTSLLKIKTASDALMVENLSGGNQQKVVLGKWLMTAPKVLLLDEPTRGVDVGAKREIYRVMSDFARAGGAVIMVSSETEEILGMADRVIVLRNGRNVGELERAALSAEVLLHLAA